MKVSLSGMTRTAAERIEGLMGKLQSMMSEDEFELLCFEFQPADSAFMLRELARHALATKKGEHSIEEFAEFYCLKEADDSGKRKP